MTDALAHLALALVFGGMAAFSFLFAPLVFAKLPGETAGGFIRAVFPWYYLFVLATSLLAALLALPVSSLAAVVMVLVATGAVLARQVLMPAINRARDRALAGAADAGRRFDLLHRGSVVLNFVQLGAVVYAIVHLTAVAT